ncbi:hypothetical protein SCUCBS95973_009095 [Sporothrix curviconia]|uniref:FHA domain-containing protein n=1 Tax=Sporothrix curviconia TaxID=1260050 RepID=A0ABP0CS38_9PEZI
MAAGFEATPKFSIGRASKTASKGLVPATDNAFFDSPVVSRLHAEVTANFENGAGPAERARSYCAPDSEDCLSDGSDCDCSSVHGDDDNCDTTAAGLIVQDTEGAEDIDNCFIIEAPELVDITMGGEAASDSESDSDYGESDSIKDSEVRNPHDSKSAHALSNEEDDEEDDDEEDDEDDEDGGGDEEEDEEEEEEEENEEDGAEVGDAEGDFLDQEFKDFDARSLSSPPSPRLVKEVTPSCGDSLPINGLWTPPSVSDKEPVAVDASAKETAAEAASNDFVGFDDPPTDTAPRATTVKCDISSILNPSPSSSPPKLAVDNDALPEPVVCLDTQEVLDATASWDLYKIPALLNEPSVDDEPQMTSALATSGDGIFMSPIVADITSRVDPSGDGTAPTIQRLKDSFIVQESLGLGLFDDAASDLPNATIDGNVDSTIGVAASTKHKMEKAMKKRKADEMAADAEPMPVAEKDTDADAGSTPVSSEEPAAKRQATPAAVTAMRQPKGRMWAVAEKIGIAALGGAVVLGSLIYTAPSF